MVEIRRKTNQSNVGRRGGGGGGGGVYEILIGGSKHIKVGLEVGLGANT